jgi:hypothetical protein
MVDTATDRGAKVVVLDAKRLAAAGSPSSV